jgi:hypothetical protein
LIGRHRQRARGLGIAGSGGGLSLGPGQGSLGGKSGTREQHGEQDTKHKAHDVTPSWLSGLNSKAAPERINCRTIVSARVGTYHY